MDEARKSAREAATVKAAEVLKACFEFGGARPVRDIAGEIIDAYEAALKGTEERDGGSLLREANRLRQVVEHLHALVHSQLGAAETVRKVQLVLSKSMAEAVDFPPVIQRADTHWKPRPPSPDS